MMMTMRMKEDGQWSGKLFSPHFSSANRRGGAARNRFHKQISNPSIAGFDETFTPSWQHPTTIKLTFSLNG